MTRLNNYTELKIEKNSQAEIEKFVEEVSDKLMINETYFGNLLLGLNGVMDVMLENQPDTTIKLSYYTDYQQISFVFNDVSHETINTLKAVPEDLSNNEALFMINNLTDKIEFGENDLTLVFDIGAMSHDIYNLRQRLLNKYFQGKTAYKSIQSHD